MLRQIAAQPAILHADGFDKRKFGSKKVTHLGTFLPTLALNHKTMRIISRRTLREFWENHADCEEQLKTWYKEAEQAKWENPAQIKEHYPSASILPDNRVVFNIKGNHYRLIIRINYDYGIAWIRFVGTHADYDKIDATSI